MIRLKFSLHLIENGKVIDLVKFIPGKSDTEVFVDLKYSNGKNLRISDKIPYGMCFNFTEEVLIKNTVIVTFFEDDEVFHLSISEKERMEKEKFIKYPKLRPKKEPAIKSVQDIEDLSDEFYDFVDLMLGIDKMLISS